MRVGYEIRMHHRSIFKKSVSSTPLLCSAESTESKMEVTSDPALE